MASNENPKVLHDNCLIISWNIYQFGITILIITEKRMASNENPK